MSGSLRLIKKTTTSANADIVSLSDCFVTDYSVYKVIFNFEDDSGVSNNTFFRLLDSSGNPLAGNDYDIATLILRNNASFGKVRVQGTTFWNYGGFVLNSNTQGFGLEMDIYNPFSSSSYTFANLTSVNSASADMGNKNIYCYKQTTSTRGLQFSAALGNLQNLKASVYGLASN